MADGDGCLSLVPATYAHIHVFGNFSARGVRIGQLAKCNSNLGKVKESGEFFHKGCDPAQIILCSASFFRFSPESVAY